MLRQVGSTGTSLSILNSPRWRSDVASVPVYILPASIGNNLDYIGLLLFEA